jgi:hypothetical protein
MLLGLTLPALCAFPGKVLASEACEVRTGVPAPACAKHQGLCCTFSSFLRRCPFYSGGPGKAAAGRHTRDKAAGMTSS